MPTMTPLEHTGHLAAVPMPIDVALDCGTLTVERILTLEPGCVIRSLRSAGDNVDIRVSNLVIAYGEIVALEGLTGVRITRFREKS
jgi:flagellar motor switch/type III secretory pathway protein FliN